MEFKIVIESHRLRNLLISGAVIAGAGLGSAGIASAASSGTSSTSSTVSSSSASTNAPSDPATLTHGPNETLLTGADLQSATTAATAAEPGATIIRAETDSGGSAYEVHMQKTDGTYATVKLDSSFTVTSTEQGFGSGPAAQSPSTGVTIN